MEFAPLVRLTTTALVAHLNLQLAQPFHVQARSTRSLALPQKTLHASRAGLIPPMAFHHQMLISLVCLTRPAPGSATQAITITMS